MPAPVQFVTRLERRLTEHFTDRIYTGPPMNTERSQKLRARRNYYRNFKDKQLLMEESFSQLANDIAQGLRLFDDVYGQCYMTEIKVSNRQTDREDVDYIYC